MGKDGSTSSLHFSYPPITSPATGTPAARKYAAASCDWLPFEQITNTRASGRNSASLGGGGASRSFVFGASGDSQSMWDKDAEERSAAERPATTLREIGGDENARADFGWAPRERMAAPASKPKGSRLGNGGGSQSLFGMLTPSGLHFERHHQGWVDIDPTRHRLMINGLVDTPLVFTMADLLRLPSVSRIHFLECGANTGLEWGNVAVPTVQYTHGMLSASEFTGVPVSLLLERAGYDRQRARFLLAEGADGSGMTRTINLDAALDDAIVAYGQNGEMLRPENGYPLRLVVPGVQGVSWVKWLRRLEVGDQPWGTKDETSHYVDLMPDGTHRQYSGIQEAKSVITSPSGGQTLLQHGYYCVTGLAWSGRGTVSKVEVSTDGGQNWRAARVDGPMLPKALTRFNFDWVWNGEEALLQSRVTDSTGYTQPTRNQLVARRGTRSIYHNNAIQTWRVAADGAVHNVQLG